MPDETTIRKLSFTIYTSKKSIAKLRWEGMTDQSRGVFLVQYTDGTEEELNSILQNFNNNVHKEGVHAISDYGERTDSLPGYFFTDVDEGKYVGVRFLPTS